MASMKALAKEVFDLYIGRMVARASAALSYFLTMTIFPMIICLYALFGQSYRAAKTVFRHIEQFLTPSAAELIQYFLLHVAGRSGRAVLVAAIMMLVLSASATVRVLNGTISEMQGDTGFALCPIS